MTFYTRVAESLSSGHCVLRTLHDGKCLYIVNSCYSTLEFLPVLPAFQIVVVS